MQRNVHPHKVPGYAAVSLSLKKTGVPPGDVTAAQMDAIAELADRYSFGELRVSHEQNLVLADVRRRDLHALWQELQRARPRHAEHRPAHQHHRLPGRATSARSPTPSRFRWPRRSSARFDDLDYLHDIGELDLNISGCMNSCGHHHVGHIGILGVDKNGEEWYQITIGGHQGATRDGAQAAIGKVIGPSFARAEIPDVVERLIDCLPGAPRQRARALRRYRGPHRHRAVQAGRVRTARARCRDPRRAGVEAVAAARRAVPRANSGVPNPEVVQ